LDVDEELDAMYKPGNTDTNPYTLDPTHSVFDALHAFAAFEFAFMVKTLVGDSTFPYIVVGFHAVVLMRSNARHVFRVSEVPSQVYVPDTVVDPYGVPSDTHAVESLKSTASHAFVVFELAYRL
jgi:hypothetical protein